MNSNILRSLAFGVSILALTSGCGKEEEHAVKSYTTIDDCRADIAEDATSEEREKVTKDCSTAAEQSVVEHEKVVTHYVAMDQCSALYERCVPAQNGNGFVPFMTGFMLGYVAGLPVYHPYYYDRYHVVYTGGTRLGYYRSGYVMTPAGSAWSRPYTSVTVNKGAPPPPASSVRGVFGGSKVTAVTGMTRPSVSAPSPSGRGGNSALSAPSSPSARGVFGGSAAAASSSSSG